MADDYVITGQRQTTEVAGAGTIVDVWEVTFAVLPEGVTGQVRLRLADASPQAVDAAIRPQVARIKGIGGL